MLKTRPRCRCYVIYCVGSYAEYVSTNTANCKIETLMQKMNNALIQQMQLLSVMLILVLVMEQFISMLLAALGVRLTLLIALKFALIETVSKAIQRMLE